MISRLGTLLALPILVTACTANPVPTAELSTLKQDHIATFPASNSFAYVFRGDSDYFVCSQTNVDAGFDASEAGDLEIALVATGDDSGGVAESSQEIEFAGRTPAVLLSREIFFRTCEFSRNYGLDKDEATTLFKESLQGVIAAWEIEAKNSQVSITEKNASQPGVSQPATAPTLPPLPQPTSETSTSGEPQG